MSPVESLAFMQYQIAQCPRCPRLVAWREQHRGRAARVVRRRGLLGQAHSGVWRPGGAHVVLGLAPAAHGGNRTGRVFTGDRSGDFLYASMYGAARQPAHSVSRDDGLELRDAYVTAACGARRRQQATPAERDQCAPFLVREVALLPRLRVVVALGQFAYNARAGYSRLRRVPSRARRRGRLRPTGASSLCARFTRASRTPSPASSRPRCSTLSSRVRGS